MFNNYEARRRAQIETQTNVSKLREKNWKKRYHTEIQPPLLEHYNKRINSFIRKMEQNPIIINQEQTEHKSKPTYQIEDRFTFKNSQDWVSIFTPLERADRKLNQLIMKEKYGDATLAYKSIFRNTKYLPQGYTQFRSRSKDKQINPPMKYTNKLIQKSLEPIKYRRSLIDIKTKEKKIMNKDKNDKSLKIDNNSHISHTHSQYSYSKHDDGEENDFLANKNQKIDIEQEARKYEKQKEVIEKKIHFKKLIDLSINMPNPQSKKQIKMLLKKCGFYNMKGKSITLESTEIDKFAAEMQKNIIKS